MVPQQVALGYSWVSDRVTGPCAACMARGFHKSFLPSPLLAASCSGQYALPIILGAHCSCLTQMY